MKKLFLYGCSMAILIFGLKWLQWKFLIVDNSLEIYIGLIALFFTALGVWVATQLLKPKVEKVIVEREVLVPQVTNDLEINAAELEELGLTKREYETLQLLAKGHSNADIANELFLSVSTIKTHVSSILAKMEVRSRTQAMEKARRLRILQ